MTTYILKGHGTQKQKKSLLINVVVTSQLANSYCMNIFHITLKPSLVCMVSCLHPRLFGLMNSVPHLNPTWKNLNHDSLNHTILSLFQSPISEIMRTGVALCLVLYLTGPHWWDFCSHILWKQRNVNLICQIYNQYLLQCGCDFNQCYIIWYRRQFYPQTSDYNH